MATRRVVITALAAVAGDSADAGALWESCQAGASSLRPSGLMVRAGAGKNFYGEIRDLPSRTRTSPLDADPSIEIATRCALQLLEASSLESGALERMGDRAALAVGFSVAVADQVLGFIRSQQYGPRDPRWWTGIGTFLPKIAATLGIRGGNYAITTACSASTNAVGLGFDLITQGEADLVVAGGIDPLSEFSAHGFRSLGALSTGQCTPFDDDRDGICIGEGGGLVLLESMDHAVGRKATIHAEVLGYGLSNDAHHLTTPDPSGRGAKLAMQMALDEADRQAAEVDYVNAHGTGTVTNDAMELAAIEALLADQPLKSTDRPLLMSSTKHLTGHCLAAAGVLELIITLMSMRDGLVIGNGASDSLLETPPGLKLPQNNEPQAVELALSNSFAFGGNNASLLVGAVDD